MECSSMAGVIELFRKTPLSSNGNYVLCDGEGEILDVEATTDGPEFLDDSDKGFIAHANHFCSARHATDENHRLSVADSFPRQQRIEALLEERLGSLTVEDLQGILRDDDNHPAGICRHPRSDNAADGFELAGQTVAALIAEPAHGRLHVSYGPPCQNPFVTYTMDG
ncbi:MAG: C45 family autoproteolytic acyltransferase/hydrolase [Thermomicrobiales bacterium]